MDKRTNIKNTTVLGFALFAMFFGAGNLIFPPFLGLTGGENWLSGFLCFIVIDAGLAVVALLAVFRKAEGLVGITSKVGKVCSTLLIAANALCLGPFICIPRTAATTFELAVEPLLPGASTWICGAVFFAAVALMCIRPTKVVDIVGKILAPLMLAALAALIIIGIVSPIGSPAGGTSAAQSVKDGLEAGYQTMDMMGALLLSMVVYTSVTACGYNSTGAKLRITGAAGIVASVGLFLVYGGLAYLGATASGTFSSELGQAGVLLAITNALMGPAGQILLSVIVTAACLTTAIGLVSAASECFVSLSRGFLEYRRLVILACAVSYLISNIGTAEIISFASPVLDLIYPVLVTLVLLSFLDGVIRCVNVYRASALMAFVASAYVLIDRFIPADLGSALLPLADVGLGWVLPAAIGALTGAFIKPRIRLAGGEIAANAAKE